MYLRNVILADRMKKLLLLILLCCIPTVGSADFKDWTKPNQAMYKSMVTLQAMDMLQTFALIECQERNPYCPFIERNPIIGKYPKKGEAVLLKLGMNFMIYKMLDDRMDSRLRRKTLIALNAISLYPVIHNEQIGLGFYIPILPYKQFIK